MKAFKNKSEDYWIRALIGSQWRLRSIGVTCSNFLLCVTSLAAEFCTRWSLVSWASVTPRSRPLLQSKWLNINACTSPSVIQLSIQTSLIFPILCSPMAADLHMLLLWVFIPRSSWTITYQWKFMKKQRKFMTNQWAKIISNASLHTYALKVIYIVKTSIHSQNFVMQKNRFYPVTKE